MMHFRISNHANAQLDVYISTPLSSNREHLIEKAIEGLFKWKEIRCVHWWQSGSYDPYIIKKCNIIITIDPENQWTQTFSTPGMVKELTPFTKEIPSSKLLFGMYKRYTDGEYCFYSVDSIYKDPNGNIRVALEPGSFRLNEEIKNKQLNIPANRCTSTEFTKEIVEMFFKTDIGKLDKGITPINKNQIDRRVLLSIL